MTLPDRSFMAKGACRGAPAEIFTPEERFGPGRKSEKKWLEGKKVCSRCPVKQECLDYAYAIEDRHALMGGLTPQERYNVRHRAV